MRQQNRTGSGMIFDAGSEVSVEIPEEAIRVLPA